MRTFLFLCALALAGPALAQTPAPPLADPWLPPAARANAVPAPQTRGAALQAQVAAKLERQFQAADVSRRGALSLDDARRAGWGFAVDNFAELDRSGSGEIRLADVQRLARERAERMNAR